MNLYAPTKALDEVSRKFNDDNNPNFRLQAPTIGPPQRPDYYRRQACMVLYEAVPGLGNPGTAWDFTQIGKIGAGGTLTKETLPEGLTWADFGTDNCTRTVTFRGMCVYAGALNYVLFGQINQLCNRRFANQPMTLTKPIQMKMNWSWPDVTSAIWYQKYARWGHWRNPEADDAFAFARVGYFGGTPPHSVQVGCSVAGVKNWPAEPMSWKWTGIHSAH